MCQLFGRATLASNLQNIPLGAVLHSKQRHRIFEKEIAGREDQIGRVSVCSDRTCKPYGVSGVVDALYLGLLISGLGERNAERAIPRPDIENIRAR